MRCLSLADALHRHGVECVFLSREHSGHLHEIVQTRGYPLLNLGGVNDAQAGKACAKSYSDWLGVDPQRDSFDTRAALADLSVDWLVVDHYSLDAEWERSMRPVCSRIMAVDDLANRSHAVDALLDQNLGKTELDYQGFVPTSCDLLLGPQYALLRHEFSALRADSLTRRCQSRLRQLLVTMGGVDFDNATEAVLLALNKCNLAADLEVVVVMGPTAPWREQVIQLAPSLSFHTKVLVNVQDMADLMRDADLAIGAAGSTSWERCCLGLPAVQLILAENQSSIASALSLAGAAHLLDRTELNIGLCAAIDDFFHYPEQLFCMSRAAANVVDGKGTERVAQYLCEGASA
jgi:UDP-2,4-diacetamido-2,4,6-trideoxy-beta-L-altropyranose hydrolase